MSNTINIGGIQVSKFYLGGSSDVKIYLGTTKLYPHLQEPCFAVVADISTYTARTYVDVYETSSDKWYKLNNLSAYEEYGIYGSGRTITTYDGKLTIDEAIIPPPSRLPDGYTEVEYIRNSNYNAYINTGVIPYDNTSNRFTVTAKVKSEYHSNLACATIIACEEVNSPYYGFGYRYRCSAQQDVLEFFGADATVSKTSAATSDSAVTVTFTKTANSSKTMDVPLYIFGACGNASYTSATRYSDSTLYSMSVVKNNETIRDFIPAKRDSDSVYGLYDLITDTFYTSPNGNSFSGGSELPSTTATCEFIYSGESWVNVGEVSGSSRLPQGYTEIEYVENQNMACINTEFKPNQDTRLITEMQTVSTTSYVNHFGAGGWNEPNALILDYENGYNGTLHLTWGTATGWTVVSSVRGDYNKHTYDWNKNEVYRDNTLVKTFTYGNYQAVSNLYIFTTINNGLSTPSLSQYYYMKGKLYSCQIYDNGTLVRDMIPCTRDSDSKAGVYDIVNDVFYSSANSGYELVAGPTVTGGTIVYPMYYETKQDPPDNVTFSSMTEAESYQCPWVGMKATIDGDRYIFSGDSQSGYEWVYQSSRLPVGYTEVEYVENQNQAYINTLFKPNQDTRIVAEMQCVTSTNSVMHFGAGGWDRVNGMWLTYETGINGTLHVAWLGQTRWSTYGNGDYNKHTYDWNKNELYKDNVFVGSSTYGTYQCVNNLAIFAQLQGDGSEQVGGLYMKGKMFSFKIYDDGTLVRDFVPCTRDSDSKAGVYDIVNDVFYQSANSNSLIAGPTI